MKRLLTIFLVFFSVSPIMAVTETNRTISFSEAQFVFSFNTEGALEITTSDGNLIVGYDENPSEPSLPWISVNVTFPLGTQYEGFKTSAQERILRSDVVLAQNPIPVPTDSEAGIYQTNSLPQYDNTTYPSEHVRYVDSNVWEDSVIVHFLVCPFSYDAAQKQLRFVDNITLIIKTANNGPSTRVERQLLYLNRHLTVSPSDSTSIMPAKSIAKAPPSLNGDSIDYVIVTSRSLANYFEPWAQWKKQKGLRSMVVTVEDIMETNTSGRPAADAIKAYLADLYYVNGLRYVLLGGDDTVVPVKYCCGMKPNTDYWTTSIPTDLYYACLDYWNKDLFWDKNKNGINGEVEDNISMMPSVAVTRLPVRTDAEVRNALFKLLQYEQQPTANGWNNSILMVGTQMSKGPRPGDQSDAEATSEILYNSAIRPYWNGERKRYFDTYSDYNTGVYRLNRFKLNTLLAQGFAFVDVACHGQMYEWQFDSGSSYNCFAAEDVSNSRYTLITTIACNTNWFDSSNVDPCLSETFMRRTASGVIGYLGCSRYSWIYKDNYTSLGPSQQFEEQFYKELFSSSTRDKNFGTIVARAKQKMVGLCGTEDPFRYVQFGLNPLGDPETPIYTQTPVEFSNSRATLCKNGMLVVSTGANGCVVCVMSSDDNGATYYQVQKNVRNAIFWNVYSNVSVCITKQNYIPKIINLQLAEAIGSASIVDGSFNADGNLNVKTDISGNATYSLKVSSASTGQTERTYAITPESPDVSDNACDLTNGVHVISLYENGTLVDSKSILKK